MGFLRTLIKKPEVQKVLKKVGDTKKEVAKKEVAKKVVEEKKDTYSSTKRKGRSSTIKTSASGLNEAEIKKKSLLG